MVLLKILCGKACNDLSLVALLYLGKITSSYIYLLGLLEGIRGKNLKKTSLETDVFGSLFDD